jgi:hypothetical protein
VDEGDNKINIASRVADRRPGQGDLDLSPLPSDVSAHAGWPVEVRSSGPSTSSGRILSLMRRVARGRWPNRSRSRSPSLP